MGQRTTGDLLFERYLVVAGHDVPEHEPDLGIGTRIDYLVSGDGWSCLCEIEQFAPGTDSLAPERADAPGSWSMEATLHPIRSKIHDGARQLRAARGLGHPLVVVLANPDRAPVVLGGREMIAAMRGDLEVRMPRTGPPAFDLTVGRNGEMTNDHSYVSAVAWLQEPLFGDGEPWVTAYVPERREGLPVPTEMFRGPNDRVLEYSPEHGRYVERDARITGQA